MELPIPYGRHRITDDDIKEVVEVLSTGLLTQGSKVKEFEEAFAAYVGSEYAVAVASGTAALHLSALALNVKPGDKVITTPITFVASANCIRYCGGEVTFVDIDPESYTMDTTKLEELLSAHPKNTFKGIIPVDFAGYPVNLEHIGKLADKYGLWILEDACHAPGGYFTDTKGKKQYCGNGVFADLSIFSFHPVKHIATGEGGMITTSNKDLYARLMTLRTHGITKDPECMSAYHGGWYYEMQELGYNYRLTDIQSALGISQLRRASEGLARRREIARRYAEAFRDNKKIGIPKADPAGGHACHLYVIQVDDRKGLYDHLREHEVFAQVHYIPVHLQPYYKNLGFREGAFPIAEAYYQQCLSLPVYPALTDEQQDYVINSILEFIS